MLHGDAGEADLLAYIRYASRDYSCYFRTIFGFVMGIGGKCVDKANWDREGMVIGRGW